MQKSSNRTSHKFSLKILSRQSYRGSKQEETDKQNTKQSRTTPGQQSSEAAFPEKKAKSKPAKQNATAAAVGEEPSKTRVQVHRIDIKDEKPKEHRIDIGDEKSNLLGYNVFSGKLVYLKKSVNIDLQTSDGSAKQQDGVNAKLSSKALIWGSRMLFLEDVISVSYSSGLRYFTVHTYPSTQGSCGCFAKQRRSRKDFRFLASSHEDAVKWVTGFSDHNCFVKFLPHPMKQGADAIPADPFFEQYIKSKTSPRVLVILNPRSGHGRSSKVFYGLVEPIFKLAGFEMEVINTKSAGHAKEIASTVDYSMCPDGIVCVGGDGIVNEVLNGLLVRNDKAAISIPIGIIPAGSDNSLVWTILGVKDPISAAITIVKGGLTPTDVFAVEWIQNGTIHFGSTVTYFGFVSDVLELSEKYQKRFGPLRYLVAGVHKFLCMPRYAFEIEYLTKSEELLDSDGNDNGFEDNRLDMSDLYADILRRSKKEGIGHTRASSLSSIDSLMTPSRKSGDLDASGNTPANNEPSEYVRALDPRSKRLSLNRSNATVEPDEVIYPQIPHSATPNWPRTRSKSRMEKGLTGLTAVNDARSSWANAAACDTEDISSTISDPGPDRGPIWDPEPNPEPTWDNGLGWEAENHVQLPEPQEDPESGSKKDGTPKCEENWVTRKGRYIGILICNHSCKTVQSSQVVAPNAEHDDNTLDLILVRGSGRWRLARFFVNMQFGRHISLPYVEYVKVKSVKVKPGKVCHSGCGIDGELFPVHGQVLCSLHPDRCSLIGIPLPARDPR